MRILLVDDEQILLEDLEETVREVLPDAEYFVTQSSKKAFEEALERPFDLAFLDVEMPGMNGMDLAKAIKDAHNCTNIVFVTAYTKYALDAHWIMSCGYFLKPLKKADVEMIMNNLRYPIETKPKLKITCFGYFDVSFKGKAVEFRRNLAKELLACFVDQRGALMSKNEITAIIWPEADDLAAKDKSFYMGISELRKSLQEIGMEDVLIHTNSAYGVATDLIQCDYLDYMAGEKSAMNLFHHEYMNQYFWAENTLGLLEDTDL